MSQFTNLINFKRYGIFYAFIILVFAVTYQSDGLFVSPLNLRNILNVTFQKLIHINPWGLKDLTF